MLKRLWCRLGFFAVVGGIVATPLGAGEFIQSYGGPGGEFTESIVATADGGFAVAGFTNSFGAGFADFWVLKLDSTGNVVFEKTYGGPGGEQATSIVATADGGFAVAGSTRGDLWVLKLDASGNIVFEKAYGGPGDDRARAILATADGGFAVAGLTSSFGAGSFNLWVLKLDATGNVLFEKTYGGPNLDSAARAIVATADGGFVVAGSTGSFGAGAGDGWVLRLDATGNVVFEKTYGGTFTDSPTSIVATADGGFVVVGRTLIRDLGRIDFDGWFLKLDATGNLVFESAYGGPDLDAFQSIVETTDGGFMVAGHTTSFGAGDFDAWVLELDATGNVVFEKTYGGPGRDDTFSIVATADGGFALAGITGSYGSGVSDFWVLKLDERGEVLACGLGDDSDGMVTETVASVQTHGVEGVASAAIVRDTAAMVSDTMSFVERQCGVTCEPRGFGFWKHQCAGQGFTQVPPANLAEDFLALEADSSVFPECAPSGCAALLDGGPQNDMRRKAERQSLALELNIASRRLDLACPADTDQTVEDVLAAIEPVLCDVQASKAELKTVKDLAEATNLSGDDLELLATETQISGAPGTTWSVQVTLANLSATTRSFSLGVQGRWHRTAEVDPIISTELLDDSLPLEVALSTENIPWLNAGDVEFLTLQVTIPLDAEAGESGSILLTALDVGSIPARRGSLSVSVTADGASSP